MATMSLDPRNFFTERTLPHAPAEDMLLLPPLSTTALSAAFKRQRPAPCLTNSRRTLQLAPVLEPQANEHFDPLRYERCPRNVFSHQTNPCTKQPTTAREPKPSAVQFEFIQINKSSGKTDSSGGAKMRSHIIKRYHENKRRKIGGPKPPIQPFPTAQLCSNSAHCLSTRFDDRKFLPADWTWNSCIFTSRVPREAIKSGSVCAQCGRRLLQQSPDGGWTVQNGTVPELQGLLRSDSHDPFDSSAIPISHNMHGLIHHCKLCCLPTLSFS